MAVCFETQGIQLRQARLVRVHLQLVTGYNAFFNTKYPPNRTTFLLVSLVNSR
jgi:hypothetical protein